MRTESRAAERQPHHEGHRPPGGSFLAAALPGSTCNIEMRPAHFLGEPRQETRGRDAAAGASADVGHVGKVGAQLLLVVVPKRQPPDTVPCVTASSVDFIR